MAYQKRNNRIKDLNQINYVKSLLEASAQKCQQAGMYTPEVYLGTAQQMADTYSNQNPQYPRISFDTKDQKLKGQATPVLELTATIGNCTSTSYFLVKDSLPEGTKASQAELTYLRPDIVSNRIATNLGITQAPPAAVAIPPIPPIDVPMPSAVRGVNDIQTTPPVQPVAPAQTQPALSKAQMMAQMARTQVTTQPIAQTAPVTPPTQVQVAPVPAQSNASNFLQGFATLATQPASKLSLAPIQPNQAPLPNANPYVTAEMEDTEETTETEVGDRDLVTPPTSMTAKIETKIQANSAPVQTPAPIHNLGKSQKLGKVSKGLQRVGNLHQSIGQVLKDMSKGEINPIQLHGDTLKIIGAFINGIPAGIQSARLQRISQQMEVVERKRKEIDLTMNIIGDEYISSSSTAPTPTPNPASIPNSAPVSKSVPAPNPEKVPTPDPKDEAVPIPTPVSKEAVNSPATDKVAQSLSKSDSSMTEAIDELLKSNASIDEKLAAIEETLDKMLEQLTKIEKNLEVIKMSLNPDSLENPQALVDSMVTETEAKTEVEVVANNPLAEVATKTEIDTEIVAEIKTQTEADQDIEVPEVVIDSTPDEDLYLDFNNKYSNEELEDIDQTMANILSSYEGDPDKINRYLKQDGLRLTLTEVKDAIFVEEINNAGVRSLVFRAEANGEDWEIGSEVNDAKKLKILESFIKAEEKVKSEPEIEPERQPAPKAPAVEEPYLSM